MRSFCNECNGSHKLKLPISLFPELLTLALICFFWGSAASKSGSGNVEGGRGTILMACGLQVQRSRSMCNTIRDSNTVTTMDSVQWIWKVPVRKLSLLLQDIIFLILCTFI